MNHDQKTSRRHLDAIVNDPTAPAALVDDLREALAIYDATVVLHDHATNDRRRAAEAVKETRRNETRRIFDAYQAGSVVTVDDILPDLDLLVANEEVTSTRAIATRRIVNHAWMFADRGVIQQHAPDVMRWVAAARAEQPWSVPIADHLVDAWHGVAGRFAWQLPAVAPEHRFHTLRLERHTETMRRTWAEIHNGNVTLVDEKPGTLTYRVNAYWPDLLPE